MKLVFTSEDTVYLHHLSNILAAKGIESVIKNDRLGSISGEIPMGVCWPELWVVDAMQESWAKELIEISKRDINEIEAKENWVCENCNEEHSSRFTDCWNCQKIKAF